MQKGTQLGSWGTLFRAIVFITCLKVFGALIATFMLVLLFIPYKKLWKKDA